MKEQFIRGQYRSGKNRWHEIHFPIVASQMSILNLQQKPLHLVPSFVDSDRFRGVLSSSEQGNV